MNQIMEAFAALAVASGIVHADDDDNQDNNITMPRNELIKALHAFSDLIQQRQANTNENGKAYIVENTHFADSPEDLLKVETFAARLRKTCHEFLVSMRELLADASDLAEEVCFLCEKKKEYQRMVLQSRSLWAALRKKMFLERTRVKKVLDKLIDLYTNTMEPNLSELCLDLATFLRASNQQSMSCQFQGFLSEIEAWQRNLSESKPLPRAKSPCLSASVSPLTRRHGNETVKREIKHLYDGSGSFRESFSIEELPCMQSFQFSPKQKYPAVIHKVLLVGREGAGKTHICNAIEETATRKHVRVHRLNIFGQTIGAMEDNIISFFKNAFSEAGPCILMTDDLDDIMGRMDGEKMKDPTSESRASHSSARALATFLAIVDSLMAYQESHQRFCLTLICTAKINVDLGLARFDDVFVLESPNNNEREHALAGFVGINEDMINLLSAQERQQIEIRLKDLATSTVGLSYAEIAQTCRKAKMIVDGKIKSAVAPEECADSGLTLLDAVKTAVQSFAPSSLRSGIVDGYVDMRVLNSSDLLDSLQGQGAPDICPLYGHSSSLAWKELESQIVIPLCRSKALNLLLSNTEHSSVHGDLSGGVVITGAPGNGKSTLARHCASFAASLLPSVKLLEVSCTSMIHKEVGGSEKAIHHLFECARAAAPCVVILDDIAIISSVRGRDNTTEGTMDRVLSTLLTELDGVERDLPTSGDSAGIAVIGITQNVDWVDPALLRPGRLGKIVTLDAPARETRYRIALRELESLFDAGLEHPTKESNAFVELANVIADGTSGMIGANVIALCNDAKRSCASHFEATSGKELLASHTELISQLRHAISLLL